MSRLVVPVARKTDGGYEAGVEWGVRFHGGEVLIGELVVPVATPSDFSSAVMNAESAVGRMLNSYFDPVAMAKINAGPPVEPPKPESLAADPKPAKKKEAAKAPAITVLPSPPPQPSQEEELAKEMENPFKEIKPEDPLPVLPVAPPHPDATSAPPAEYSKEEFETRVAGTRKPTLAETVMVKKATDPVPPRKPAQPERDGRNWKNHVVAHGKYAGSTLGQLAEKKDKNGELVGPKIIEWYAMVMGQGSSEAPLTPAEKETRWYSEHGVVALQDVLDEIHRKEAEAEAGE